MSFAVHAEPFPVDPADAVADMPGPPPPMVHVLGHAEPPGGASRLRRAMDPWSLVRHLAGGDATAPALVVISLADLPERHAAVVRAVKRVRPDARVLLADCEGRAALLAQLVLYGADGLIAADGSTRSFHVAGDASAPPPRPAPTPVDPRDDAVLSPEELAALLGDDDDDE